MNKIEFNKEIDVLRNNYRFYGPKRFEKAGRYSDTDMIRYDFVSSFDELDFSIKSDYSAKEFATPLNQRLFFFTEDEFSEPTVDKTPVIVFLRQCDYHAYKRLDEIYLRNRYEDKYYKELRELIIFAVVGCHQEYDNCFCVSMNSNKVDTYDIGINYKDENYEMNILNENIQSMLDKKAKENFILDHVTKNEVKVEVDASIKLSDIIDHEMWREYDKRCIACGACNFVCPTCSCFTTQDVYYDDSKDIGERRRAGASCMVEGFSTMAGGHKFREKNGDKIRFKAMHKVVDFEKRFGYSMCVGCGRCSDVCPELIDFAATINKLNAISKESNE